MQNKTHEVYSFADFRLDVTRGALFRGDTELRLRPKSFDVLKYLLENSGELITKDKLIDSVWDGMAVTDDSLVQCLKDIRRALDDVDQTIIKTVPRRGYIFDLPVNSNGGVAYYTETSGFHLVIEEEVEDPALRKPRVESEVDSLSGAATQHKFATAAVLSVVLLVLGGVAFGLYAYFLRSATSPFKAVTVKRLTSDGRTSIAAISPDGKYVAYASREDPGKESLSIRQVSEANSVQISAPAELSFQGLSFSPDGKFLYYVQNGTLYQTGTLGGSARRLRSDVAGRFAISPDGSRIAFVRQGTRDGLGSRVIITSTDGSGEERILATRKPPESFTTGGCSWSPDGETIICSAGDNALFGQQFPMAIRVVDGNQIPLTNQKWNMVGKSAWLGDGDGFIMTAWANRDTQGQLWHVTYPGGVATRMYSDLNRYSDVSLTADGTMLTAIQQEPRVNIYVTSMIEPQRSPQPVTFATNSRVIFQDVSSEGDEILYMSEEGGSPDLWIMDARGENRRQLTFDEAMESDARFSPDGRSVGYAVASQGIWRVDLDGGDRRQLTEFGMFPTFSPDGNWIFYTLPRERWSMWRVPASGGDPIRITDHPAVQPSFSPDGTMIAYMSYQSPTQPRLCVAPASGGDPVKVFDALPLRQFNVMWTPDGSAIAYKAHDNEIDKIVSQPLDGSPPLTLLEAKSHLEGLAAWGFSADGGKLYYSTGPVYTNAVLFTLER